MGIRMDWYEDWPSVYFSSKIGYLGESNARVFGKDKRASRVPTTIDSMNFVTDQLSEMIWVSLGSLIHTCKFSTPQLPTILAWLNEEGQKNKEVFAVSESIVKYLP